MAEQSGFRRILTSMQNTVQGRATLPPGMSALQKQRSSKEGWLKKQGGLVKSWHMRWFTIKGDQLYYFATDDESKPPLGVIFLPGNRVNEMPYNPSDPDKYLFEIVPGSDRSRMTATHETYPICATSEEERKAWVHAIKKVMYYDKGGAIFGQALEDTMAYEKRVSDRKVPQVVEMCVEFIIKNGLEIEGIFRLPGRNSLIKKLREEFDTGERPAFTPADVDVHSVASLLKLYLRELPMPLIPVKYYERVMKLVTREFHLNPDASLDSLAQVLQEIPRHNYNLLQYLSHFLLTVSQREEVNRMSIMNLATVFVQNNIIQPEEMDAALLMGTANGRTQVAFLLITYHDKLFKMDYTQSGVSVHVDNLIGIDTGNDFRVETAPVSDGNSAPPRSASDLLGLDLNSGLPSPMAPETVTHIPDEADPETITEEVHDVETDGMDDEPDADTEGMHPATGDEGNTSLSSSLSQSASSFTEVTADMPSDDMTTSWSCSSYDVGSYPNTPSQSYPGTPSTESQPQQQQPQVPPRPPRPMARSRSHQEVNQASTRRPSGDQQVPIAQHVEPPRPVRPAPAPPLKVPARQSLSSSSVSTESVDTVDSGHVDTEEDDHEDDRRMDVLLAVSLDNMSHEELMAHVESLREELLACRSRNQALQAAKTAMKDKHQQQVLDLAKKIDTEKTATANAVQKVMDLQNKLQKLELKHGNLV